MPFVKRDDQGHIVAVSRGESAGFEEELDSSDPEISNFAMSIAGENSTLSESDLDFVRVVEDLIELLVAKNFILFTDLPEKAQDKMRTRRSLRGELSSKLNLISEDDDGIF